MADHTTPSRVDLTIGESSRPRTGMPWLGVHFVCAGAYQRVFRARSGPFYIARCPRCGRPCRFRVGAGGTPQRLFKVSC